MDKVEKSSNHSSGKTNTDVLVKMTAYEFQGKLATLIENIARGISHVDTSNYNYEIDEASFSININEEGNLSVLSILKEGIADGMGIRVKLKRKSN